MFANMTIGKKLFSSIGAALAVALLMGITTMISLSRVNASLEQVVNMDSRRLVLGDAINSNLGEMISIVRAIEVQTTLKNHSMVEKYHSDYLNQVSELNRNIAELTPLVATPAGSQYIATMSAGSTRMAELNERIYQKASADDVNGSVAVFLNEFRPYASQLREQSGQFAAMQVRFIAENAEAVKAVETQAAWLTIVMLLACLGLVGVVVLIVRRINQDLRLTASSLSAGADQIAAVAAQTAENSQSLALGATSQAASIEETSAAAEEINSMAQQNAEHSQTTAKLFADSAVSFQQANQNLGDMVAAMGEITESSSKIAKIIKVIDEIAFQTNILALNAAVEAARAGEHGMGFAVVAEEVRSLAQRSAQAAKDTATLIEESIAKASNGKDKVDQVATIIRVLSDGGDRIKTLIDGVSQGSKEQSSGIEQIGKAITEIEKITQTTAANSEESAATAEELSAQAEALKETIERLRTMVGADAGSGFERASSVPRRNGASKFRLASTQNYARPATRNALLAHAGVGSLKSAAAGRGATGGSFEDSFQEF
jgi:methyl-accepting chemotaxis protein